MLNSETANSFGNCRCTYAFRRKQANAQWFITWWLIQNQRERLDCVQVPQSATAWQRLAVGLLWNKSTWSMATTVGIDVHHGVTGVSMERPTSIPDSLIDSLKCPVHLCRIKEWWKSQQKNLVPPVQPKKMRSKKRNNFEQPTKPRGVENIQSRASETEAETNIRSPNKQQHKKKGRKVVSIFFFFLSSSLRSGQLPRTWGLRVLISLYSSPVRLKTCCTHKCVLVRVKRERDSGNERKKNEKEKKKKTRSLDLTGGEWGESQKSNGALGASPDYIAGHYRPHLTPESH